ncbi:predicted protein [Histoplasma capsulatum G186AR]|uniref:Uncharacterized protein n=1 Tax=Ajellomyces capsulatus (strain G186AR / H82 / ATCC MYA-2454 / RMSCC 2432) TaxID=447093 RepID=C0NEI9_AJECG|nr:uncharacterized protein HCBG_01305 [Histoplasma capsulatum G186AR]EEH09660.1 predicted protein [Histoplasma capsulatum G186AR]
MVAIQPANRIMTPDAITIKGRGVHITLHTGRHRERRTRMEKMHTLNPNNGHRILINIRIFTTTEGLTFTGTGPDSAHIAYQRCRRHGCYDGTGDAAGTVCAHGGCDVASAPG